MSVGDPIFWVTVFPSDADGGGEYDGTPDVISMTYEDDEQKPDVLKLSVNNFDLRNFDSPKWKNGNRIEVAWGYVGVVSIPRQLTISKVTGGTTLSVEAKDGGMLMNKQARERIIPGPITRSDVVRIIAADNGYGPERQHIDDTEELIDGGVRGGRNTDYALLRGIARRQGWQFYIDFDGLHFHPRRLGAQPLRTFRYYLDKSGDILTFNVENDIYEKKAGTIQAGGRDLLNKQTIDVKANNATTPVPALAPEKVIIAGISVTGEFTGDFTQPAPAPAPATPTPSISTNDGQAQGTGTIIRTTEPTVKTAQQHVDGMYANNQLTAVEMTLECRGDPLMLGKVVVAIEGLGKSLSGNYYCKSVNHKIGSGYTMTVKVKRDGRGGVDNTAIYNDQKGSGGGAAPVKPTGPVNNAPAPPSPAPGRPATPPPLPITINPQTGAATFNAGPLPSSTTPYVPQDQASHAPSVLDKILDPNL